MQFSNGPSAPGLSFTAEMRCPQGCCFPVRNGVPRCIAGEDYSGSFGFEWTRYPQVQLDSNTGVALSAQRLERCLGMPLSSLADKNVLEAGCGSGRFTEVMLAVGARVCSLDLSNAVEANYANHAAHPNFFVAQADLRKAPYRHGAFDIVICIGVLQHTPNPEESIRALARYAKPGGLVVIDHYSWGLRRILALRYFYRAWLRRLHPSKAHAICRRLVERWLPLHRWVGKKLLLRAVLSRISPITTYYHRYDLPEEHQRAFAYLDTFDFLTPRYERLRTLAQVRRAMEHAGLVDVVAYHGGNGVEARGRVAASCAE